MDDPALRSAAARGDPRADSRPSTGSSSRLGQRVYRIAARARISRRSAVRRACSTSAAGGGDLVVAARAARGARRARRASGSGVDPDPRAHRRRAGARARPASSSGARMPRPCVAEGARFDAVLSNHVLHHLSADGLPAFADESLALSDGIVAALRHPPQPRSPTASTRSASRPFAPGHVPAHRRAPLDPPQLPRRASSTAALGRPWRVERRIALPRRSPWATADA